MREKQIEQKFVMAVKREGGMCPKLVCPGLNGMPDRLVLLPGGRAAFVEVKAPGKELRSLQKIRHERLRDLGFWVFLLDDPGQIDGIIQTIKGGARWEPYSH